MLLRDLYDPNLSDDAWRAFRALQERLFLEHGAMFVDQPWEKLKARTLGQREAEPRTHTYMVEEDAFPWAWLQLRVQGGGDTTVQAHLLMEALSDEWPRPAAAAVAATLADLLDRYGLDSLGCMLQDRRTCALPELWGADKLNRVDRYRLRRERANFDLMDEWLEILPVENPGLRLASWSDFPPRRYPRIAELFNMFFREMPSEGEDGGSYEIDAAYLERSAASRKKTDGEMYVTGLIDESDEIVAYSCSFFDGKDPRTAYQAMTGVHGDYRGRGLSKWLKAALFLNIGRDFPANEEMITDMRAANAPIQAVNAAMGYRLESEGGEYKVSLRHLRKFLAG